MHAIGAQDATASFELQVNPEGQEGNPEVEVQQPGHEEPEEDVECPNHKPASFVKGVDIWERNMELIRKRTDIGEHFTREIIQSERVHLTNQSITTNL